MLVQHGPGRPNCILAIETSCDDTAAAVVADGRVILASTISSQTAVHERFGGVVPEVASRKHVETITWMIEDALDRAKIGLADLCAVAVTQGPGLVGSLLVGVTAAKSLACAMGLPLIGVHHIAGHIYANRLVQELAYPLVALVVSGGHTELVFLEREGRFRILGQTRDDAAGEAYDKVGRAMGLPYPGGPHMDRLASAAESGIVLPRSWLEPGSYDFSFSGLKSAVLNVLNQAKMRGEEIDPGSLAKGFQDSVVEVLTAKALQAVRSTGARQLLLAGGVAANQGLRAALAAQCAAAGISLVVPPLSLCMDNAAMIGAAAHLKWERRQFFSLDLKAEPVLSLEEWSV